MTVICREWLLLNRLQEGSSASPPQTIFMMGMLAGRLFHRQMQIDEAGQVILITNFRLSRSIWEIKREWSSDKESLHLYVYVTMRDQHAISVTNLQFLRIDILKHLDRGYASDLCIFLRLILFALFAPVSYFLFFSFWRCCNYHPLVVFGIISNLASCRRYIASSPGKLMFLSPASPLRPQTTLENVLPGFPGWFCHYLESSLPLSLWHLLSLYSTLFQNQPTSVTSLVSPPPQAVHQVGKLFPRERRSRKWPKTPLFLKREMSRENWGIRLTRSKMKNWLDGIENFKFIPWVRSLTIQGTSPTTARRNRFWRRLGGRVLKVGLDKFWFYAIMATSVDLKQFSSIPSKFQKRRKSGP